MSERKVAVVTNGMSALGSAICRRLQRDGFQVTASHPPGQHLPQAWRAAQRDDGFVFGTLCADPGAPADCAALVDAMRATHGRLDVLVHLVALPAADAPLHAMTPARWQGVRGMLDHAFHLAQAALPGMLERRWGRIIQVAPATAGGQAIDRAAASAALLGLGRALALETARHGVTVNTIVPGCLRGDARGDALLPHIPVGRLGEPDDVAALAAYLVSDLAGFVTGAQIPVDGGLQMG